MVASPWKLGVLLIGLIGVLTTFIQAAPPASESEKILREASEPLKGFNGCVATLAFSPDGRTLFGGGWGRLPTRYRGGEAVSCVWRTKDWEVTRQAQQLPNHHWPDPCGLVRHAAFLSRGNWLVTVTDDHQLKLFGQAKLRRAPRPQWFLQKSISLAKVYPESPHEFQMNAPSFTPLRISPDQQWLALPISSGFKSTVHREDNHWEGLVELWKITSTDSTANTGPEFTHHLTIKHPPSSGTRWDFGMEFGKDSKTLVTATEDLSIHIWNVEDGSLKQNFAADDGLPNQLIADESLNNPEFRERSCRLDVSPDGKMLAVVFGHIVRLYDLQHNRWLLHHSLTQGGWGNVTFHPTGRWLITTSGGAQCSNSCPFPACNSV